MYTLNAHIICKLKMFVFSYYFLFVLYFWGKFLFNFFMLLWIKKNTEIFATEFLIQHSKTKVKYNTFFILLFLIHKVFFFFFLAVLMFSYCIKVWLFYTKLNVKIKRVSERERSGLNIFLTKGKKLYKIGHWFSEKRRLWEKALFLHQQKQMYF